MLLAELQLLGILDRDDPFVVGDQRGQDVQEGRLPGVRPSGHDDVQASHDACFDETGEGRREGPIGDQILDQKWVLGELPDRQEGTADGQRMDHGVDS